MKKNIIEILCKLEGYKTAIKNCHFSAKNMSTHKTFDKIGELVDSYQDKIAEVGQGIHGQFNDKTIKPIEYKLSSPKKFLDDMLKEVYEFHKSIQPSEYLGLRSVVESFIADLEQCVYLLDLSLKEDFKHNYKKKINESFEIEDDMLNDAIDALDMSDGQIDFYEWSAAYQDYEDENHLIDVWNMACEKAGYNQLKESCKSTKVKLTESQLTQILNESVSKVISDFFKN